MGSALVTAVEGIERPTIGLLNIGEEDIKGNDVVKRDGGAAARRRRSTSTATSRATTSTRARPTSSCATASSATSRSRCPKGLVVMLYDFLRTEFTRNPVRKLAALAAMPALSAFKKRVDPRRYNGATLSGLKGVVVKSHGGADRLGFLHALLQGARRGRRAACSTRSRSEIAAMPPRGSRARACQYAVHRAPMQASSHRRDRPLPAGRGPHQRGARAARRDQRRVDPHAHRHPPAAHRRRRTRRRRIWRCMRRARRIAAAGMTAGRHRPRSSSRRRRPT